MLEPHKLQAGFGVRVAIANNATIAEGESDGIANVVCGVNSGVDDAKATVEE
jgi:hypothetical protein